MQPAYTVIADDLTGAAELAAAGHAHGLQAAVCTHRHPPSEPTDLVVYDTDSRLLPPVDAAARVGEVCAALPPAARSTVFKKTDSVLRGPVAAELTAAAAALGRPRILLVPANPSLGRTMRGGRCYIDEVPLAETAFARDPHHPAVSSEAVELLGPGLVPPAVAADPADAWPDRGVVIGNATHIHDLDTWASRLDDTILAAGGADFFCAWLRRQGCALRTPAPPPVPGAPVLVIAGSTAPASRAAVAAVAVAGGAVHPMPASLEAKDLARWRDEVAPALRAHGRVVTSASHIERSHPSTPAVIRAAFAALATDLHARGAFAHLIIEGGATAAAITRALGWSELTLVHTWAPGVVALRPANRPALLVTLKPGSYAWPDALKAPATHSSG